MKLVALASVLLLAAACGPKSKPADPGTGEGGGGDEAPIPDGALAAGQWESLDKETRAKWMGKVVKPAMKELFTGFDAEEFAEFDCETCHGEASVQSGSFEMPTAELPALSGEMIMNPDEDHKAITDFMKEQVKPKMAELLGVPQMDQANPEGFACMSCHPSK